MVFGFFGHEKHTSDWVTALLPSAVMSRWIEEYVEDGPDGESVWMLQQVQQTTWRKLTMDVLEWLDERTWGLQKRVERVLWRRHRLSCNDDCTDGWTRHNPDGTDSYPVRGCGYIPFSNRIDLWLFDFDKDRQVMQRLPQPEWTR